MPGLGTLANCAAIAGGALLGLFLKRGLPEKWQETMMSGIALCIFVIGVQMALKSSQIIITIMSLVLGAVVGEACDIEGRVQRLGDYLGARLTGGGSAASRIAEGFVSASILFCTGAMAIVGSIQDGLARDCSTLFAKATLDGIISMVMSANLGAGVALSAASVGLYQGTITLLAGVVEPYITREILAELTASGGVMIMAIGANMLRITRIRIGNLLPGIAFAALLAHYFA